MKSVEFARKIHESGIRFHPVVPFQPQNDGLLSLNFTTSNALLTTGLVNDSNRLSDYIQDQLKKNNCMYGIGGYGEHRTLYASRRHFDGDNEPRRLHLGTDIWGPVGTKVMAPADAIVHSFGFNNNEGDYGATIILTHHLNGTGYHTLYGHLSLNSLKNLQEGRRMKRGEVFTEFGMRFENGNWPSHLHFQIILDMQAWQGDYPGVCKYSEREQWLENCPDPDLILGMNQYVSA